MQAHFGFQTSRETPRVAILLRRKRADAKVARLLSDQEADQTRFVLSRRGVLTESVLYVTARTRRFLYRCHVTYFYRRSFLAVVARAISIRRRIACGRVSEAS
jgi:hypothetical protein